MLVGRKVGVREYRRIEQSHLLFFRSSASSLLPNVFHARLSAQAHRTRIPLYTLYIISFSL